MFPLCRMHIWPPSWIFKMVALKMSLKDGVARNTQKRDTPLPLELSMKARVSVAYAG